MDRPGSAEQQPQQRVVDMLDRVRGMESNKEQRYLLRLAMKAIQPSSKVPPPSATHLDPHAGQLRSAAQDPDHAAASATVTTESSTTTVPPSATSSNAPTNTDDGINVAASILKSYVVYAAQQQRNNTRLLEVLFELCQRFLSDGIIPVDAVWPSPTVAVPEHITASTVSKFLGFVKVPTGSQNSTITYGPPVAVYDALSQSVLQLALVVQLSDPVALCAISAVTASALPEVVHTCSYDAGDADDQASSNVPLVGLSGPTLAAVLWWLFSIASRSLLPSTSALAPIARAAIVRILNSILKDVERDHHLHHHTQKNQVHAPASNCSTLLPPPPVRTAEKDVAVIMKLLSTLLPVSGDPIAAVGIPLNHESMLTPTLPSNTTASTKSGAENNQTTNPNSAEDGHIQQALRLIPPPQQPLRGVVEVRVLSLTLLLQMFVNGGLAFRRSSAVVTCVRHFIFPMLLQTALSTENDVFRISLNIFWTLYTTLQSELVVECGAFFQHVICPILASENASMSQKELVLELIKQIAEEPKNLLHLFLNYDCSARSINVYESVVQLLDQFASPKPAASTSGKGGAVRRPRSLSEQPSASGPQESRAAQRLALASLLCIAEANIQWIDRCEIPASAGQIEDSDVLEATAADALTPVTESGGSGTPGGAAGLPACSPSQRTPRSPSFVGDLSAALEGLPQSVIDKATSHVRTASVVESELAPVDVTTMMNAKKRKHQRETFLTMFNMDQAAERAITFLSTSELLPAAPPSVARRQPVPPVHNSSMCADPTAPGSASSSKAPPPRRDATSLDFSSDDEVAETATRPHDEGGNNWLAHSKEPDEEEKQSELALRIALFLYEMDGVLDRLVLGEFFAKSFRKPLHQAIFQFWVEQHPFRNLSIDEALRLFLGGFKLLGEAQIVDRTMELFAAHYCLQNPTAFASANTAFVLSFSICMLNTDAHSAHVAEKMSRDAFTRNNRGIDDGKDLDLELLHGVYDRITHCEIKLRPLKAGVVTKHSLAAQQAGGTGGAGGGRAIAILESIPLLRQIVPIAGAITDTVMIPVDAAGDILFNRSQRKRSEKYHSEFHRALRDALELLREQRMEAEGANAEASRRLQGEVGNNVEYAIPMWDVTVDAIVAALEGHLARICFEAAAEATGGAPNTTTSGAPSAQTPVSLTGQDNAPSATPTDVFRDQISDDDEAVFEGVVKTLRVCAAFGSMTHAERLIQKLYQLSMLGSNTVSMHRTSPTTIGCEVVMKRRIPWASLRCAIAILEGFALVGSAFTAEMWKIAYQVVSVLDALFSVAARHTRIEKSRQGATLTQPQVARRPWWQFFSGGVASVDAAHAPNSPRSPAVQAAGGAGPSSSPTTAGAPLSSEAATTGGASLSALTPSSRLCVEMVDAIRSKFSVELWIEQLYDATSYSSQSLLQMVIGLCSVCTKELEVGRVFSLSRLAEFCTVCTSVASRMQWRDLWLHAEPVFTSAGLKDPALTLCAIDGLKGIAYHYLLKEEMNLYRFQKELLRPFERILMRNASLEVRRAIQIAVYEMVENRAPQLSSGWSVILSVLSHGALIPELVGTSWDCCELLLTQHLRCLSDVFGDVIFCITSFASNGTDPQIAKLGASYLVACGSWLQRGLVPLGNVGGGRCGGGGVRESSAADVIEASAELLDHPLLVELDNVTCLDTLRRVCVRGGRHLGLDFSELGLSRSEWRKCYDSVADGAAPDDVQLKRVQRMIRLLARCKAEGVAIAASSEGLGNEQVNDDPSSSQDGALIGIESASRLQFTDSLQSPCGGMEGRAPDRDATEVFPEATTDASSARQDTLPPLTATDGVFRHGTSTAGGAAPRVSLAPAPLLVDQPLTRPAGFGMKTAYHLWASLFEGMVPIIIAHAEPNVRLHAIGCLWELVRRFGRLFAHDAQLSLLAPLLRSAISAIAVDEGLAAYAALYEKMLSAAIRGMFYACAADAHLVLLALTAFSSVANYCKNPMCVQAGLVRVLIDVVRSTLLRVPCEAIGPMMIPFIEKGKDIELTTAAASDDDDAQKCDLVTAPQSRPSAGDMIWTWLMRRASSDSRDSEYILDVQSDVTIAVCSGTNAFVAAKLETHMMRALANHALPGLLQGWDSVAAQPPMAWEPVISGLHLVHSTVADAVSAYANNLTASECWQQTVHATRPPMLAVPTGPAMDDSSPHYHHGGGGGGSVPIPLGTSVTFASSVLQPHSLVVDELLSGTRAGDTFATVMSEAATEAVAIADATRRARRWQTVLRHILSCLMGPAMRLLETPKHVIVSDLGQFTGVARILKHVLQLALVGRCLQDTMQPLSVTAGQSNLGFGVVDVLPDVGVLCTAFTKLCGNVIQWALNHRLHASDDAPLASASILVAHELTIEGNTQHNFSLVVCVAYHACLSSLACFLSFAPPSTCCESDVNTDPESPWLDPSQRPEVPSLITLNRGTAVTMDAALAWRLLPCLPSRSDLWFRGGLLLSMEKRILELDHTLVGATLRLWDSEPYSGHCVGEGRDIPLAALLPKLLQGVTEIHEELRKRKELMESQLQLQRTVMTEEVVHEAVPSSTEIES